ncbi:MAG TPA: hypothetical protein VN921_01385 [Chthoniobacterales bacterium]|nr:hypothetical protein [Chthoniobacterales bacterium]
MRNILKILEIATKAGKTTEHIKIENGSWMPLTIEEIGLGPHGLRAISVCHYVEQNGDLMRDPEMCFEVTCGEKVQMYPYSYRNDYMGIDKEVYSEVEGERRVNLNEQKDQASFARTWNRNIAEQGFIEAYRASL